MGDLSTSLFALGYHENLDNGNGSCASFLLEMRRCIFARIYAADKSLSIFMGRPHRIAKDYCNIHLPSFNVGEAGVELDFTADARCNALFCILKEQCLSLFRKRDHAQEGTRQIRAELEHTWSALPDNLRLTTTLNEYKGTPFELDVLVNVRLDYLHTHFLLGLLHFHNSSEPDVAFMTVASELLSLVVNSVLLRGRLRSGGSSLEWKVSQWHDKEELRLEAFF